jgi:hypothetical protein
MALLSSIFKPSELARLSDAQIDVLTAALDAEILTNPAVKKAVSQKIQSVHKELAGASKG